MADETTKVEKQKAPKKVAVTNEDIIKAVSGMSEAVMQLVETLKPKPLEAQRDLSGIASPSIKLTNAVSPIATFPVPLEWRELVDTTLNKEFGVEIVPEGDTASFGFSVLVPQKYSNAGKPHWESYHEDRRTRIIPQALGLNGVREWVTKIYENFDPETKSRITFDRSQL